MAKLAGPRKRALEMMATAPDGKIDMTRGRASFRDSTICSLENDGYALWCDPDEFEPTAAIITDAGRAALEASK